MADLKISQLPLATNLQPTDVIPVVASGVTSKATIASVLPEPVIARSAIFQGICSAHQKNKAPACCLKSIHLFLCSPAHPRVHGRRLTRRTRG